MDGWHFTSDAAGWRWHCIDVDGKVVKGSSEAFPSLIQCIGDAMKHGYSLIVAGPGPAREDSCSD
jgi:hypothetical protein